MQEPSTNFAYLAHHDARLVALATQAEEHFAADPTVTLFKLRQFGEVLAQRAAAKVGLFISAEEGQQQLIDRLWDRNVIGATQRALFHDLRRVGNAAVHEGKGYFPKELPPTFFTEHFAAYATSHSGRAQIANFHPNRSFTECVDYELALPGGDRRLLALPHPGSFASLAQIVAKDFRRLLRRAAGSKCTRSRPIYSSDGARALRPSTKPSNLGRERAIVRGGARYLLKVDVSQFYPSLYTHAIGWAIDPRLRDPTHWRNAALLGKKLDQALMEVQGKISHGIPIGNDISFLLAEIVLAEVDKTLKVPHGRAVRWFDDYEIACDSLEEAERWLAKLQDALASFRLKLNRAKTSIISLPDAALDTWQTALVEASRRPLTRDADMLAFFDTAFRLRLEHPGAPVLNYALGLLFRVRAPTDFVAKIAQSSITQAMLAEPGSTQKALALLTFWNLNGLPIEHD